ncbi:uncharacterized protein N7483_002454 [Penicillium malachiteum]|uniref:uncharacterized protein n=1 Tax=Penicillium malachiteum TaxID=1324776 RepID=UPI0025487344|nr:uncharacterized protein N7483_002454 [Penicillium malachiteum]KAJ5737329.1 hypothetical protein N7483_002454 [Penicillium malachiteum]
MRFSSIDLLKKYRRPFPSGIVATTLSSTHPIAPNNTALKGSPPVDGMKDWLLKLGYQAEQLNQLNVIHVAGTKGKGSTCALVDCFLRQNANRSGVRRKIGLYTSPSLRPNNRIRIDSQAISDAILTKRIVEVEQGLSLGTNHSSPDSRKPGFLQMMAVVAFHHFIQEGVDVVICEAHHGGQFDATNFIERPIITAITRIGMDHVDNLGGSIQNIAWHKGGIFKENVSAFSAPQVSEAEHELRHRAEELKAPLHLISNITATLSQFISDDTLKRIPLEQRENFALAAQITYAFLQRKGHSLNEDDINAGIDQYSWSGRFSVINFACSTWYLDGAHNETSIELAAKWYERLSNKNASGPRVLVFAHFSPSRTRDWKGILEKLGSFLGPIQHAVFVQKIEADARFSITNERLDDYAEVWRQRQQWPSSLIYKEANVRDAIDRTKNIGSGAQVLAIGSLYLVEALLEQLNAS